MKNKKIKKTGLTVTAKKLNKYQNSKESLLVRIELLPNPAESKPFQMLHSFQYVFFQLPAKAKIPV